MTQNLLKETWADTDPVELRLLLEKHFGGPGQYHDRSKQPNRFHLPLAGSACQIVLVFERRRIAGAGH